ASQTARMTACFDMCWTRSGSLANGSRERCFRRRSSCSRCRSGESRRRASGQTAVLHVYEPSSRTRVSLEMAATLLGAMVYGIDRHEPCAQEARLEYSLRVLIEFPHDF